MKKKSGRKTAPRTVASELVEVRARLSEAEETLRAIRSGEVDALLVSGKDGDQVFTLVGAEHAYRVLIESMHEGALTLTADEVILYANTSFAEMVNYPLEQIMGGSFRRFLSGEDILAFISIMKCEDAEGAKIQVRLSRNDGTQMHVQISVRPLAKNGMGRANCGMVVTDMTEAHRIAKQNETERLYQQVVKHAEELERRVEERTSQLTIANQELEAFESSISHDLRAPLRHVTGFSEMLLDVYGSQVPEEARRYLNRIREGVTKMEHLIKSLLEFSRMGKKTLSLETVDIGQMWRDVLAEQQRELGRRSIEVVIASESPLARADPVLLRQALINLLGNALKYTGKRGHSRIEISFRLQPDGGPTVHCIKDNGAGFDMKHSHKLFTVFQRLHDASEFEGTGVGLTTVQRIIQKHGGRIWVESAPDVGTTFFFTLSPPSVMDVSEVSASAK